MVSLGVSNYVNFQFATWRVIIKIWWAQWVGMSATNIYLHKLKIQSNLQNKRLWMPVHQNSFRRKKHQKLLILHSPFCIIDIKMWEIDYHLEYFEFYFSWWNHQICFKMVRSSPKNPKSRDCQFQVCYLHTTHLGPLNHDIALIIS